MLKRLLQISEAERCPEHLKESFPEIWLKAENSVLKAELGNADDAPEDLFKNKENSRKVGFGDFILLGGPPCKLTQSLVGPED